MRKFLKLLVAAALLLGVAIVVAGWLALRASLPQLDGEQPLAGLGTAVELQRDALGTVTIDAHSRLDAIRALGFVHGQERFFEMDLMRRLAAGELAALLGVDAVDMDRKQRVHRMRARMQTQMTRLGPDDIEQLQAYADGINAGLDALGARPWAYWLLQQKPQAWRPEDSLLAGMAMYFDLQGGDNEEELALWFARDHLPPAIYSLLAHAGSDHDAPLDGRIAGNAELPGPDEVDVSSFKPDQGADDELVDDPLSPGSNNFAVAGNLTADGRALVADDMHLGLAAPNIWFRARLRYADVKAPGGWVDVQGFTLPGLPAVVVGSNGHIAWGFTNSYADTMDWRVETPCSEEQQNDCAPLRQFEERIEVANSKPVDLTVEESDWGPVLKHAGDEDERVLTLRWVAHLPDAINLGLSQFAAAASVDEALAAADTTAVPAQNLVVGDADGRIAWRILGVLPARATGCRPERPMENADYAACPPWPATTRGHPVIRSPQMDRLWTANARVVSGEALERLGDGGYALGARAAQIRDSLLAADSFDEQALLDIQLDDRALFLAPWHALLMNRADVAQSPALQTLADAAKTWGGRAAVDSASYRLVRHWRLAVHDLIDRGLTAPAREALDGSIISVPGFSEGVVWPLVTQRPAHLLPPDYGRWDDLFEQAAQIVRDDLEDAGPLTEHTWGERNTSHICHPLAVAVPIVGRRFLCMPHQPLPGDSHMPRVQGVGMGASQRMVVAPGNEAAGIIHMPGGQSGHPLSPFWGAGHSDWAEGRPSPFLPGYAKHELRLVPNSAH